MSGKNRKYSPLREILVFATEAKTHMYSPQPLIIAEEYSPQRPKLQAKSICHRSKNTGVFATEAKSPVVSIPHVGLDLTEDGLFCPRSKH